MGTIALEGMHFYARHGYYEEEKVIGSKYSVDVYIKTDTASAAENDDIAKTVNYEKIFGIVKEEMQKRSRLLETLAHRILETVCHQHPGIQHLQVKVTKFNPPINGLVEKVSVSAEK